MGVYCSMVAVAVAAAARKSLHDQSRDQGLR